MSYFKNELSWRSQWHISKHRYLELVHFCLQYEEWRQRLREISLVRISGVARVGGGAEWADPTARHAEEISALKEKIRMVEKAALDAEESLANYILISVTQDIAFPKLQARMNVPCGKDMFYDRRRKFFWLLDRER